MSEQEVSYFSWFPASEAEENWTTSCLELIKGKECRINVPEITCNNTILVVKFVDKYFIQLHYTKPPPKINGLYVYNFLDSISSVSFEAFM